MGRNLSWRPGYSYCEETNRDGSPCGNLVPHGIRVCAVHRARNQRDRERDRITTMAQALRR